MKTRLLAAVLLAAGGAVALDSPPPATNPQSLQDRELRGLWVVRTALFSPDSIDRVVDQAGEAGFNALFVQVRGRGDAFYQSRVAPRSVLLQRQPASFDPLARLIERAQSRGLAVHAWINVLLTAGFSGVLPAGHIVTRHPDWLMVPGAAARSALSGGTPLQKLILEASKKDPDVEGYYLSPSAPGVREHLAAVVSELVREYAVDGLHLDFIRLPGRDFDYSRAALEAFSKSQGLRGDLADLPARAPEAWTLYKRDVVTSLASLLAAAARASRPGAVVSAAVFPDEVTALQKSQAWPSWMARGILDAVCPMVYTPDSRIFREQVAQARSLLGPGRPLWAGIGSYRLSLEGTIEKIALARTAGASGVVLFSHESFSPADGKKLREGAFVSAGNAALGLGGVYR